MNEAMDRQVKVTSMHIHDAGKHSWDCVTGEERIAKVGMRLRFFLNDFDESPKRCKPITLEFKDGVVDIVGEYVPIHKYHVAHIESADVKGDCGCMLCVYGADAFTGAERKMMVDV